MDPKTIERLMGEVKLARQPKKLLSTFGSTRIRYHLVSPVEELADKSRLREGWVVSERPKVLTPELLRDRFQGFGEQAREFSEWLSSRYQDLLRALEYTFQNKDLKTRVVSEGARAVSARIRKDADERGIPQAAVIECPDAVWSLALMNFTLEEAARSFPTHVRDLDRRGLFDSGSGELRRRRRQAESLFKQARGNPAARAELGRHLRESGLFEEYEDRFLSLFS